MADRRDDPERSAREAADWAARFNRRAVDTEALEAFARWRRDPQNARAYDQVEASWRRAAALGADRDVAEATRAALGRGGPYRLTGKLTTHPVVGLLFASLVVATMVLFLNRPVTYSTAVGEQRLVSLADGSQVHINTDSKLSVRVDSTRRELELERGEAYFDVAHDTARPFVVRTSRGRIVATGTRFDVDRREGETRVTLIEGRVRIYDGADAGAQPGVFLNPGETIELGRTPPDLPRAADTNVMVSWLSGQLVFHQTPLATAIAEMNRYTSRKIRLDAAGLGSADVDGRFAVGDVDAFVGAVTTLFPLHAVTAADGGITLTPAI